MNITINGEPTDVQDGATVLDIVADLLNKPMNTDGTAADGSKLGIAVALSDTVIARSQWASTTPVDGDTLEIITAVQGG